MTCRAMLKWKFHTPARVAWLLGFLVFALAAQAASTERLTIGEGVVVKFGPGAELEVAALLTTESGAVLTSLSDDTVGGQVTSQPGTPEPGDWRGVRVTQGTPANRLAVGGLSIRYAESALQLDVDALLLERLAITDNQTGITVSPAVRVSLGDISLNRNGLGLQSGEGAELTIAGSDISGNDFGVLNLGSSTVVDAVGNWWGSVDGPTAADNPGGNGDAVSAGVNYGQYLQEIPLLDCSVVVADGQYTVPLPDVILALACRNAVEYRLSASPDFDGIAFEPIAPTAPFLLQPPAGAKQVYAQYRAETGNMLVTSLPTPVNYSPGPAAVSILTPEENAEVASDTTIVASAAAAVGIERVEFFVAGQRIGTVYEAPYEQLWQIAGFSVGDYTLKVVAYPTAGQSAQATRIVRLRPLDVDPSAPVIENLSFNGDALDEGTVVTRPGLLSFAVTAPSGVRRVEIRLNGVLIWSANAGGSFSTWLDFASSPNGAYVFELRATNNFDIDTVIPRNIEIAVEPPPAPVLLAPVDGGTVARPQLPVNGTAQPGSRVQVYLDGVAVGGRLSASSSGGFATTLVLPDEGTHRVAADAKNSRGTGPSSVEHWVTYAPSDPQISFTSPLSGTLIDADTDLAVAIVDTTGITQVQFALDGAPLATRASPPWTWRWPIASVSDGPHTLTAQATNAAGRFAQAEVNITVQKIPPPPPPVPTPYVGELLSLAPALSYGDQPIIIQGRAVERDGGAPVPDALMHVVLEVGGHQRKINVATDASGLFTYTFQPMATDAGIYQVSVRHPEQADATWQDQFTIDRILLSPTRYTLRAARTVMDSIPIKVTASTGSAVTGLRFEATPSEQPSGSLPPGVQIVAPEPITLAAGASRTLDIGFLGSSSAPESGTVILVVYAQESGGGVRGRVTVPFQLSAPLPALVPRPTSLQGGLAQGGQITLTTQLSNQGLLAAEGVTVQLLDGAGTGPAASWLTLSTPATLGTLPVGASQPLQVTASPDATVTDGVHYARLRLAASNTAGGDIPIAISLTQSGIGSARFHAANIYTQTLDDDGNPILGLAGARIRVQHETVPTLTAEATTDSEGLAEIPDLAAGHYTWRASAPGHNDSSGRIRIQPGVAAIEDVFLDMNVVSIEWEVTETTIPDEYEVVIEATYQTEVPAPVVMMEPLFINLPALQTGEEYSGELKLSNYGLVRADNIVFTPPQDDAYLHYEFMGEVPSSLEARERVTLTYKVTALQPLASANRQFSPAGAKSALPEPTPFLIVRPNAPSGGTCGTYRNGGLVRYDFICANGSAQGGSCGTMWGYTWGGGGQCGGSSGGGSGGGGGGGWDGGPGGSPLPGSLGCSPNCKKCCTGGGASGGGGGGGGGDGGGGGPGGGSGGPNVPGGSP